MVFAWDNAVRIRARKRVDEQGWKHYELYGPLFFGSTTVFAEKFDVEGDPEHGVGLRKAAWSTCRPLRRSTA